MDSRAKAAREMIPHSASQFADGDHGRNAALYGPQSTSISIDMASAAKAVAWSQLWDNDEVISQARAKKEKADALVGCDVYSVLF